MRLSIIVPVYNVEEHLLRCLESIAMQMRDDYELILVDDGSTDQSGAMCDAFACEHPELNVVVVHQPNGGLSVARNAGIERVRGEYLTFVDSDDYIDAHTLVPNVDFLLAHSEVDMLEYPIEVHSESAEAYVLSFSDETLGEELFVDWIRREGYTHSYACNKIYRTDLWHELRFPVGVYFEDGAIMPDVVRRCRNIHYSSKGCYRYVAHAGTITTNYKYVKFRHLFANNHRLYLFIKDTPDLRSEVMQLWTYCLNQLIDMGRCADVDRDDYEKVIGAAEAAHPSYKALLGTMFLGAKDVRNLKLLPLPLMGLATYLRIYVALTTTLR